MRNLQGYGFRRTFGTVCRQALLYRPGSVEIIFSRPLRVLLADDEEVVRFVVKEYLCGDGHTVVTAANGQQCLDRFHRAEFDVVILDRAMPGMNGDQVAVAIKQIKPETPTILLTGFGSIMQASGETPPGIDLVLAKPVTIAALRSALAKVVPAR